MVSYGDASCRIFSPGVPNNQTMKAVFKVLDRQGSKLDRLADALAEQPMFRAAIRADIELLDDFASQFPLYQLCGYKTLKREGYVLALEWMRKPHQRQHTPSLLQTALREGLEIEVLLEADSLQEYAEEAWSLNQPLAYPLLLRPYLSDCEFVMAVRQAVQVAFREIQPHTRGWVYDPLVPCAPGFMPRRAINAGAATSSLNLCTLQVVDHVVTEPYAPIVLPRAKDLLQALVTETSNLSLDQLYAALKGHKLESDTLLRAELNGAQPAIATIGQVLPYDYRVHLVLGPIMPEDGIRIVFPSYHVDGRAVTQAMGLPAALPVAAMVFEPSVYIHPVQQDPAYPPGWLKVGPVALHVPSGTTGIPETSHDPLPAVPLAAKIARDAIALLITPDTTQKYVLDCINGMHFDALAHAAHALRIALPYPMRLEIGGLCVRRLPYTPGVITDNTPGALSFQMIFPPVMVDDRVVLPGIGRVSTRLPFYMSDLINVPCLWSE